MNKWYKLVGLVVGFLVVVGVVMYLKPKEGFQQRKTNPRLTDLARKYGKITDCKILKSKREQDMCAYYKANASKLV